jgi:hypothetical protein
MILIKKISSWLEKKCIKNFKKFKISFKYKKNYLKFNFEFIFIYNFDRISEYILKTIKYII